ncbi:MAG TPA: peptide-methionine (S)-S-oxide reductase MsrA [Nitrososphaerales archaeon]|nr:peptide-methionine (S)-S-oxide reductase MsrA [Nitrososphaerales archaeon]
MLAGAPAGFKFGSLVCRTTSRQETATLGSGCFWCSEAVFSELEGVLKVEPGFSGGSVPNPTYEQVCTDKTGHAEVAQVTFDPDVVSFRELLEVFFSTHDPTSLNRQGSDVGKQYRSVIFYGDDAQRKAAEEIVKEMTDDRVFKKPIVTEIVPLEAFYPAEDYHREYFRRNPGQPYCRVVIAPKLEKFRAHYRDKLKKPQATTN